jgi:hypothetical protein
LGSEKFFLGIYFWVEDTELVLVEEKVAAMQIAYHMDALVNFILY